MSWKASQNNSSAKDAKQRLPKIKQGRIKIPVGAKSVQNACKPGEFMVTP